MTITLYRKPGCFGCDKTEEKFIKAGMVAGTDFRVVDLTETPAALEYVTEELGYRQAPVVVIDDQNHWSGLNPTKIEEVTNRFKEAAK